MMCYSNCIHGATLTFLTVYLGLDWSDESTDEDEEAEERIPSLPQAWRLQEGSPHHQYGILSNLQKPMLAC